MRLIPRIFYRIPRSLRRFRSTLILLLGSLFLLSLGKIYYDTNSLEVRLYEIRNSPVGRVLAGLKVAHLSDLHIQSIGRREKKVIEILKKEKPDLIFITGDLIAFRGSYEPVMDFLQEIKAPLGVFAILGNTEYSNENGSCIFCHREKSKELAERAGRYFLRNSSQGLKINGRMVNIIGLDDPVGKRSSLMEATRGMDPGNPSVLLAHSPEVFEEALRSGIDLLLCGHTHGGQIFLAGYLAKSFPLMDPAFLYLEGFFREGNTLLHVNRGIGTSFLPFRLGVKPEVTFFTFANPPGPPENSRDFIISNASIMTLSPGFDFAQLWETFNFWNHLNFFPRTDPRPQSPVFFDFESGKDLERLNWECGKWFELSPEHATSGRNSLRLILPPGKYPGINFRDIPGDWSKRSNFRMDIFNPSRENCTLHVRIDDNRSGWEYADRFDRNFDLEPGMNRISIPLNSIKTNIHPRPLNLDKIKQFMFFVPDNPKKRELFMDNIRLE